jgi:glycine cleavage system H protein
VNIPKDLKYTKDHEWLRAEGDLAVLGVTDYAQKALGDVVFVELPKVGDKAISGKSIAVVESVKSVSDLFSPVSGEVVEVNKEIEDYPENINKDPYGSWILKIRMSDSGELEKLMDSQKYLELVGKG